MYTIAQLADPEVRGRVDREREESTPTPVWHLSRCAGIPEKDMLYHLGRLGAEAFRWGEGRSWHVSKADARKLMGLDGDL